MGTRSDVILAKRAVEQAQAALDKVTTQYEMTETCRVKAEQYVLSGVAAIEASSGGAVVIVDGCSRALLDAIKQEAARFGFESYHTKNHKSAHTDLGYGSVENGTYTVYMRTVASI